MLRPSQASASHCDGTLDGFLPSPSVSSANPRCGGFWTCPGRSASWAFSGFGGRDRRLTPWGSGLTGGCGRFLGPRGRFGDPAPSPPLRVPRCARPEERKWRDGSEAVPQRPEGLCSLRGPARGRRLTGGILRPCGASRFPGARFPGACAMGLTSNAPLRGLRISHPSGAWMRYPKCASGRVSGGGSQVPKGDPGAPSLVVERTFPGGLGTRQARIS